VNLLAVRVKANAHYQCQECGSTELIQAHHERPGDDDSLISLCAECHSQRHPDLPKALFFTKSIQPYWHNKSASSLAQEWRVSSRTIIRAAKRLGIQSGELSPWDEELIRNNIPKMQWKPKIKKRRYAKICARCNYSWQAIHANPYYCPRCGFWVGSIRVRKLQEYPKTRQPFLFCKGTVRRLQKENHREESSPVV